METLQTKYPPDIIKTYQDLGIRFRYVLESMPLEDLFAEIKKEQNLSVFQAKIVEIETMRLLLDLTPQELFRDTLKGRLLVTDVFADSLMRSIYTHIILTLQTKIYLENDSDEDPELLDILGEEAYKELREEERENEREEPESTSIPKKFKTLERVIAVPTKKSAQGTSFMPVKKKFSRAKPGSISAKDIASKLEGLRQPKGPKHTQTDVSVTGPSLSRE